MMCGFALPLKVSHLILAAMLFCGLVWTQATPSGFAAEGESIEITSQTMIAEGNARRAIFEGTVVLTKGDFVMRSDSMIVRFEQATPARSRQTDEKTLNQQVEQIEATGHVVLERADGTATSGRAVYYKDEDKVVLTDSPVAWHNGTKVTGTRMTFFVKEERSVVEGNSQVTIFDDQER